MATDDVIVRMRLVDELSSRLARIRTEVAGATHDLDQIGGVTHQRNVSLLGGSFDGLSGRLQTLDGHLNRISASLGGAFASGIRNTTLALGVLTAATTAFGITALNQFSRAHAAFNTLTGSVAAGNQLFQQVAQLNLRSPFDMPPLLASSQTLLGFGFNSQQTVKLLQGLSNVAAVQQDPNEALTRMSLAVGQIKQTGALRAQDLNQLVQSGFPAYALANQLGGGNARDILRHGGSIPSDQFLSLIATGGGPLARYSGAAQAMNLTPAGQFSNIKFTLQQTLAEAFAPLGASFVKQAPGLQSSLGGFLTGIAPSLTKFLGDLMGLLQEALPILQPILSGLFTGLHVFFSAMAPAMKELAPIAQQIGVSLANLFTALAQPVFIKAIVDLIGLLPTMIDLLTKLVPILAFFVGLLDKALSIGPVATIVSGLLVALLGYRVLSPLLMGTATGIDRLAASLEVLLAELGVATPGGLGGRGRGGKGIGRGGMWLGRAGLGIGGGLAVLDSQSGQESWGKDLEAIGGGAALGAGIGLLGGPFAEITAPVGALIGGGIGALDVGVRRLFGHHSSKQSASAYDPSQYAYRTPEGQIVYYVQPGAIQVNNPANPQEVTDGVESYFTGRNQRGP